MARAAAALAVTLTLLGGTPTSAQTGPETGAQTAPTTPTGTPPTPRPPAQSTGQTTGVAAGQAAQGMPSAGTTPPGDAGQPPIHLNPPPLPEVLVTPSSIPSFQEELEYHENRYNKLQERFAPAPPAPTRSERLLGQPDTMQTGTVRHPNPLLETRGAIPHEVTIPLGQTTPADGGEPSSPPPAAPPASATTPH